MQTNKETLKIKALFSGDPLYQMFEIKLAICIDLPQRMAPGIFITCPDIMEPFTLKKSDWDFEKPGITAIAHPSPFDVGTTHGVFILAEKPHVNCSNHSELPSVTQSTCIKFLHKPSKERMYEANAVFLIANEEYVYTDGEFYMDWATTSKLVKLYKKLSPLGCEIDAFGDFLQALGENGDKEYCKNVANVVEVVPKLVETREKFYHELKGTQFNVLLLNKSKFYHIGTMTEYLEVFCDTLVMR
jgi:fucose-1-phosphate guanylyltransferase